MIPFLFDLKSQHIGLLFWYQLLFSCCYKEGQELMCYSDICTREIWVKRGFSVWLAKVQTHPMSWLNKTQVPSRKYNYTLRLTSQGKLQCSFQNKTKDISSSGTNTVSEDACHLWYRRSIKMITSITSDLQGYSCANPPTCHGPSVVHHT